MPTIATLRHDLLAFTVTLCIGIAPLAAAQSGQCEGEQPPLALRVAESLGYPVDGSVPFRSACMTWPNQPDITLVALAYRQFDDDPDPLPDPEAGHYDLDVLLLDSRSHAVKSHAHWQTFYVSDSLRFESLAIDAVPYLSSAHPRVFGLRAEYRGEVPHTPYRASVLSLFVEAHGTLRPVLEDLTTDAWRGDWDLQCEGLFENLESTVAVAAERQHGWPDLTLHTHYYSNAYTLVDGRCIESSHDMPLPARTLRYDGEQYPVSPLLPWPSL